MIAKNNLFNIRYNAKQHWLGEIGQRKGFVVFERPEYSIRACLIVLRSYHRHGRCSIRHIVERFAPSSENDTASYIRYLCKELYCDADDSLTYEQYLRLVVALAWYETNSKIYEEDVSLVNSRYGILSIASTISFNVGQLIPELHTNFIP